MNNKMEVKRVSDSNLEEFNEDLLRLIALDFPDYRIWVDIRNMYFLTKRRMYDISESCEKDDGEWGVFKSNKWFKEDECLAACVMRIVYPDLAKCLTVNDAPFEGAFSFRELVYHRFHLNEKKYLERIRPWVKYPFVLSCVKSGFLDINYPVYLIDWEGDLTPKAWLVMNSNEKSVDGFSVSGNILSHIVLDENDCRSLFRCYPSMDVYSHLTSNSSLLYWAMMIEENEDMENLESRRERIFEQILDDFRENLDSWKEYRSSPLMIHESFVDAVVPENVCSAFTSLIKTSKGTLLHDKLWNKVLDEVFVGDDAYIAVLFICILGKFNLRLPAENLMGVKISIAELLRIDSLNNSASIFNALAFASRDEHFIDVYRNLCEENSEYMSDYISLLEGFSSYYAVYLDRHWFYDEAERKDLVDKLLKLVNERVSMSSVLENAERNRQFQSLKEHLDAGWPPRDDEFGDRGDNRPDEKPDGKPEEK